MVTGPYPRSVYGSLVDVVLIVLIVIFAVNGYRQGFAIGLLSFAGFFLGAALGLQLGPWFANFAHSPTARVFISLSTIFLVAIGVAFPIYLNTFHGIRMVDRGLIEMGRIYGLSPLALYTRVILPGALPSILVGLRYALGISWLALVVAETVGASSGLGFMAMDAREFLRTDVIVLSIIIYALLGIFVDVIIRWLERRLLVWHPSYAKRSV